MGIHSNSNNQSNTLNG